MQLLYVHAKWNKSTTEVFRGLQYATPRVTIVLPIINKREQRLPKAVFEVQSSQDILCIVVVPDWYTGVRPLY